MSDDKNPTANEIDPKDTGGSAGAVFPTKDESASDGLTEKDADEQVHSSQDEAPAVDKETDIDELIHKQPPVAPDPGNETDIDDLVHRK